jgi:ADP-heptose:LPS heptosyltransferase
LRRLAAAIAACDVFVSNDAAPMHISAALGTPTVGLFGPGEETIWFPYGAGGGHVALRKEVPCHPCHLDVCNRTGNGFMECMKLLSFSEVFAAVERALDHHRPALPV